MRNSGAGLEDEAARVIAEMEMLEARGVVGRRSRLDMNRRSTPISADLAADGRDAVVERRRLERLT